MPQTFVNFPPHRGWDDQTQKTVGSIRKMMHAVPQPKLSFMQRRSVKDAPAQDGVEICQTIILGPGRETVSQALFETIDRMGKIEYKKPVWEPLKAEWVTCKNPAGRNSFETVVGSKEQYLNITQDLKSPAVILYLHGGAFFQGSAGSCRPTTGRLARLTEGRCFSINYRLSPQHTFPAALMDTILAYLELLFPSKDSLHTPVSPSNIVLAGDSAGANICFALLQFILQMKSSSRRLIFQGQSITLPLPAGIASLSLFVDHTLSLPSHTENVKYDIFGQIPPWSFTDYPSCDIWPTSPRRPNVYCDDLSYCHPFLNPAMAESWAGSPPMLMCYGEEQLMDGGRLLAQNCINDGVTVVWEEFHAMPHCFAQMSGLRNSKQTVRCFDYMAEFIRKSVSGLKAIETSGRLNGDKETRIDMRMGGLHLLGSSMTLAEATQRMRSEMEKLHDSFRKEYAISAKL